MRRAQRQREALLHASGDASMEWNGVASFASEASVAKEGMLLDQNDYLLVRSATETRDAADSEAPVRVAGLRGPERERGGRAGRRHPRVQPPMPASWSSRGRGWVER